MALGTSDDRRRSDRVATNRQMDLLFESRHVEARQQKISVVDMSLLGVRIRTIGVLVPGQKTTLIPTEHSIHNYPCRVVWVRSLSSQMYSEAGLEFCAIDRNSR
jgi:hypothetical protein